MSQLRNMDADTRGAQFADAKAAEGRGRPVTSGGALRPSHQHILDAFIAHGSMTPDELADKIARSVFYTRPRCSELRAMGLLRPTGEVRRNAQSGLKAGVLSL